MNPQDWDIINVINVITVTQYIVTIIVLGFCPHNISSSIMADRCFSLWVFIPVY